MTQTWAAIAAGTAVALIVFFDWAPTSLNRNIAGAPAAPRLIGGLIHLVAGGTVVIGNLAPWRWVVLAGAVWYSAVLLIAIVNWWVPWLTGVTVGEITPESFRSEYDGNVRVLPQVRDNPIVPDVQHTILHVAVLAACVANWASFASL